MADYCIIFINNEKYIIKHPTHEILYQAQLEYENILTECKFNQWMSHEDCVCHLVRIGKWVSNGDQKIDEIMAFIDKQKVDLYHAMLKLDNDKQIRKQLYQAKDLLMRLHQTKTSLESFTLNGFAQVYQQQYILEQTAYYNGSIIGCIPPKLLGKIKEQMYYLMVSTSELRELAHTDPWRSYCGISTNPFAKNIIDLDYDKRALLTYSKMYDRIYESPDCPPDNIVKDNDALDGWMIVQRQQKDENKQEKRKDNIVDNLSAKYQHSNEIFIPVKTKGQIENVDNLNSLTGKMVKKQRQHILASQGQVGVGKLPDEVLERSVQATKQFKDSVKN